MTSFENQYKADSLPDVINGLYIDGNTRKLGGDLIEATTINLNENTFTVSGTSGDIYIEETIYPESIENIAVDNSTGRETSIVQAPNYVNTTATGPDGTSKVRVTGEELVLEATGQNPIKFTQQNGLYNISPVNYDVENDNEYFLVIDEDGNIQKTNNKRPDGQICYAKNTTSNVLFDPDGPISSVDAEAIAGGTPTDLVLSENYASFSNTGQTVDVGDLQINHIHTLATTFTGASGTTDLFITLSAPNLTTIVNNNAFATVTGQKMTVSIPLALHTHPAIVELMANNTVTLINSGAVPTGFKKIVQNRSITYLDDNGDPITDTSIIALLEASIQDFSMVISDCTEASEPLNVLTDIQPTPTETGNTTNLNSVFKDANGDTWIVDSNGDAIKAGSVPVIFKELNQFHVDKNGNDTTGTGADEKPVLTITQALTLASQADAVIVNEGTYAEAVTISTQNLTLRGQGQEYGGLTEINSLAITANGTSVRVSSLTSSGTVTHSGTSPFYMADMTVVGNYTSSTTAYSEIKNSRLQDGTISKTAAGILFITDSLIGNATFSTPSSVISLRNVTIDAGDTVTIGAGVIYSMQDVVGNVVINAAAIPVETALLAQGATAEVAKSAQTSSFNMLRMLDPDTNASPTKFVTFNETTKRLEISNTPTGGGSWSTGTVTPTATGNTATSLGVTSLPAFYENTTTGVRYYIDANGVSKAIEGRVTTSLLGRRGDGSAYVNPTMVSETTLVDAFQLSDGTHLHVGQIKYPAHGLVKHAYYFGSATAPYYTVTPPTSGILQQVFYVTDENTIDIDIEQGVAIDLADYANVVYVNNTDVNNGTIYDTNNPPTTNNDALKNDSANLYIGSDGSLWVWNGTAYVTKPATSNTEWWLGATQVDAGNNKTSSISRSGWVFVGANKNATCPLDLENNAPGTAFMNVARYIATNQNVSGRTTMFTMGANQSAGNIADWRFFYAGAASGNNRSEFGFSGNVSPNLAMLYNGLNGVGTTAPVSKLEVAGSFGATVRGINANTTTSNDFTVLMNTAGITLTLEAPGPLLRRIMNVKNTTSGTVTVTGHIDGVAGTTITLAAKASRTFQSNGNSWFIIGGFL